MNSEKRFDGIASGYDALLEQSLSRYGKDISYYAEYKVRLIRQLTIDEPGSVLEFGCGTGRNIEYIKKHFPSSQIVGSDISSKSLQFASKQEKNAGVSFLNVSDLAEDSYDLIFIAGVFHHVIPEERKDTMNLLDSLLSEGGRIFVFEHNPYNPLTQRAVNSCPFDEGVALVKPKEFSEFVKETDLQIMRRRYCLFFPSMLRGLAFMERFISFIPLGGQYVTEIMKVRPSP
jgi:SAM-dependent methyltransferase